MFSHKPSFLCRVVKPRVNSVRPKCLGLGASLMEAQTLASAGSHHPRPDGDRDKAKEGQPQGLMHGGAVLILSGCYRGLYGKVRSNRSLKPWQLTGTVNCRARGRRAGARRDVARKGCQVSDTCLPYTFHSRHRGRESTESRAAWDT